MNSCLWLDSCGFMIVEETQISFVSDKAEGLTGIFNGSVICENIAIDLERVKLQSDSRSDA